MGLFRRRRESGSTDRAPGIAAFWQWWADGGAAAVADAPGRAPGLAAAVAALEPNLSWQVGPGHDDSVYCLVVTAEGNAELRALARRWLLAAPAPDAVWTYADTKPAATDPAQVSIQIGAWDIDVDRAVAQARVAGTAVHVTVHHPDFHHLDEGTRDVAALLLLDVVLGEADVETWVGEVRGTDSAPLDAFPLVGLRATVRDLKGALTTADGSPQWAVLRGTGPGDTPVLAMTWTPLRPGLAPHLDTHVPVALPYADRTEEGLPGPAALAALRDLEDALDRELAPRGAVVAHETNRGTRILHVYVDGTTPAADTVRAVVAGWSQGRAQVGKVREDAGWEQVAHLRA